jgi:YidC/Oxa1 family membrane protein insertase
MDNMRLFLFAGLAFVGMLLWQQWQVDYGPVPVESNNQSSQNQSVDSSGNLTSNSIEDLPDMPENQATQSTTSDFNQPLPTSSQLITVETDVLRLLIDTQGGVVRSARLKKYPVSLESPDEWLEILHSQSDSIHIAQSGLRNKENSAPTHHSLYSVEGDYFYMEDGDYELEVPFYWQENGIEVVKTYRLRRGDYLIDVQHEINNSTDLNWEASQYRQLQRSRPLEESRILYTYTGSVYFNELDKYEKVDFDDMEDAQLKKDMQGGWVAMIQHYFLAAWVPVQDETNLAYSIASLKRQPQSYAIGLRSQNQMVSPGSSGSFTSQLFVGPKIVNRLEEIAPGLDLTVDYGVLTFLSKPLYWLLSFYHSYVGNWGFAIILLTLTVKAIFFKLSEKSYRSMARMRKVGPRLKTLKERYGDDRQKMNQAMMELYKTEKINPMGGCLPIVIQIPVFIALYWALLESVDLRQAPFIFWINDLSVMDPYFVLPVIMGVSMLAQQKLNPAPPDPIQAKVMMALPIVFTFFFAFFPSGLVLYWVINNLLSITQQYIITKRIEAGEK